MKKGISDQGIRRIAQNSERTENTIGSLNNIMSEIENIQLWLGKVIEGMSWDKGSEDYHINDLNDVNGMLGKAMNKIDNVVYNLLGEED